MNVPFVAAAQTAPTFGYQVPLTGTNQSISQGQLTVTPGNYSFGTVVIGSSVATTTQVKNTGQDAVNLTGFDLAAPYSQSNSCPSVLVGGAACNVTVTYTPTATGTHDGVLNILTDDPMVKGTFSLNATTVPQTTNLTMSGSTVDFGATDVGGPGANKSLTITNAGNSPATVNGIGITGTEFNQSNNCGAVLAPGASCTINLAFFPAAYGARSSNLSVYEQASGTLYSVALTGSGNAAVMSVSPSSLTFGAAIVDYSSSTSQATVYNTGNLALNGLSLATTTSDYSVSASTCGSTLAAGANCTVTVRFAPVAAGARPGALNAFSTNGGAASVPLTASGTAQAPAAAVNVTTLAFGNEPVDGSTAPQMVTFNNTGNVTVNLGGVTITSGSSHYALTSNCGATLAVGSSCTASVTFTPRTAGPVPGALRATFSSGNLDVAFSGTGTLGEATVNPATVSFSDQQVASTSAAKTVTVTNTGNRKLTFSGVSVITGAANFAQSNNCAQVAPAGTCTVNVSFTPSVSGPLSGTLAFVHDGVNGTTTVALDGVGRSQAAALTTPNFASTAVGSSSTGTATLSNMGVGTLSVAVPSAGSVTGASYSLASTTCGTSLAVGANCTTTVRFSPTSTTPTTGTLNISTGAGVQTANFGSTGIQGFATVNPSSLAFAAQQVSSTSTSKVVTVTNTGSDTLTFTGVGISVGGSDFAQSNNCGSVAVGGTCTVNVAFTPSTAGARSGMLSFTHNGGGIANVDLSGTGQAQSASVTAVEFGSTNVGSAQTATATLSNTGIGALSVTPPVAGSVTGSEFSFVSTTCGPTLAVGASCTTTARFSPLSGGSKNGILAIATGAGTQNAALSGIGNQAVLTFSSPSTTTINWGARQVGGSYASSVVTLTNSGNVAASGLVLTPTSVWTLASNTCGATLNAASSCTFVMMFNPTAVQAYSGVVTASASVSLVTNQMSMTGSGVGQSASLSTPSFPPTAVGSSSTAVATLSNTGLGPLSVTVPTWTATSGAAYSFVATDCTSSLAVGGTCAVTVRFSPTSTAAATGVLAVVTGAGQQNVSLGSTGIQGYASVSPGSLTFGTYGQWTTSPVQTVTVTNTGTNTLTFTGVGISVGGSDFAQSNNCGAVAVGGTCTVNVTFSPSTDGARSGTLSFTHNGGGIANVSLSGTGQRPSGSLSMGSFPTTSVGSSSTAVATYTNTGIGPMPLGPPDASSVTGDAAFSFVSTNCTSWVAVGSSCATTIRFSPTNRNAVTGNFRVGDWNQWNDAALSSTGIQGAVSLSAGSIAFPNETASRSSSTLSMTVTNTGNTTLTISSLALSAGSPDFTLVSTNCVGQMGPGGACTATARFAPTTAGAKNGTISFAHNGAGPTSFPLTGTAYTQATITSKSFSPATVTVGGTSTFSWSTADASAVNVSCSGAASGSGSGASGSITVSTNATGTGTCTINAANVLTTGTTDSANLSVVAAPSVATASFSPSSVMAGNTTTFSWTTSNATSASVSCGYPASGSGSGLSGSITVSTSAAGTGYCTTTVYNAAGNSGSYQANLSVTPAYTYSWQTDGWSTPAACGATTATRSVWCQRSDGATVGDTYCGGGKPATTTGTTDYSACSYNFSYGGWNTPAGCGYVTQTRSATCYRSDGAVVSNSYCGTPVTSQGANDYSACSYSFSYGAWSTPAGCGAVTQTRSATCYRSDGAVVSNAYCGTPVTSQGAADYSGCSYSANLGGWSTCSNSCGTGTQSRSVSCTRSDGATVDNGSCGYPATSQSCTGNSGCTPPSVNGYYTSSESYGYEVTDVIISDCAYVSPDGMCHVNFNWSTGAASSVSVSCTGPWGGRSSSSASGSFEWVGSPGGTTQTCSVTASSSSGSVSRSYQAHIGN